MSRPVYGVEHDSDDWWSVTRNGWRLDTDEFFTREEAEAAIDRYEREDEENEREAREQDDDEFGARVDYEMDKDR